MERDTVVIACHLYKDDCDKFKELCQKDEEFHAEVLRRLILHYIKYRSKGWTLKSAEEGWKRPKTIVP